MRLNLIKFKLNHLDYISENDFYWIMDNYKSISSKQKKAIFESVYNLYVKSNTKCECLEKKYNIQKNKNVLKYQYFPIPEALLYVGALIVPLFAMAVLKDEIKYHFGTVGFDLLKTGYPILILIYSAKIYKNRDIYDAFELKTTKHPIDAYRYNKNLDKVEISIDLLNQMKKFDKQTHFDNKDKSYIYER